MDLVFLLPLYADLAIQLPAGKPGSMQRPVRGTAVMSGSKLPAADSMIMLSTAATMSVMSGLARW